MVNDVDRFFSCLLRQHPSLHLLPLALASSHISHAALPSILYISFSGFLFHDLDQYPSSQKHHCIALAKSLLLH